MLKKTYKNFNDQKLGAFLITYSIPLIARRGFGDLGIDPNRGYQLARNSASSTGH
jgi:hypothetical protein